MSNDGHNHDTTAPSLELVSTGWEPCPNFAAAAAASPVCAGCGWLADEHGAAA
jgi:hypothetical protein